MKSHNHAAVLCCNLSGVKADRIRMAAVRLGLRTRTVTAEEFALPLGRLLGLPMQDQAAPTDGAPFDDELVIFYGLTEPQLDAMLAYIRRAGGVRLKAVVTPTNAAWSVSALCRELEAERAALARQGQART